MSYNNFCSFLMTLMTDHCYRGESWVVYFKCLGVYREIEEHYELFSANFDDNCIEWFDDWYEGQTNIDLLGAYNIVELVKNERK